MQIRVALRPQPGARSIAKDDYHKLTLTQDMRTITHVCQEASRVLGVHVDQCFDVFNGKYVHISVLIDIFPGAVLFFVPSVDPSKFEYLSMEYMEAVRKSVCAYRDLHPSKEFKEKEAGAPRLLTLKELAMLQKIVTADRSDQVDWEEVRLKMDTRLQTPASCAHLRRQWESLKRIQKGERVGKKARKGEKKRKEKSPADSSGETDSEYDTDRDDISIVPSLTAVCVKEGGKYEGGWKFICGEQHKHRPENCCSVRHGRGKLTLTKKPTDRRPTSYDGGWRNNFEHGEGVKETSELFYSGGWHRGAFHGKGKLIYDGGDTFVGTFDKGWYEKGKLTRADQSSFEGLFAPRTNLPLEGLLTFLSGPAVSYCGSLQNGNLPYGKGTMTYADIAVSGNFVGGNVDPHEAKLEWLGTALAQQGNTMECEIGPGCSYEGDINPRLLVPHGKGRFRASNGMTFRGLFVEGVPKDGALKWDGFLVAVDPLHEDNDLGWLLSQYFGTVNPKFVPHGQGSFVFDEGAYKGGVVNGVLEGEGELHWLDAFSKDIPYRGNFVGGRFIYSSALPPPPVAPKLPPFSFAACWSKDEPSASSALAAVGRRTKGKKKTIFSRRNRKRVHENGASSESEGEVEKKSEPRDLTLASSARAQDAVVGANRKSETAS